MDIKQVIQDQYKLLKKIKKSKKQKIPSIQSYGVFVKKCLKYLHEATSFFVPSYEELKQLFMEDDGSYYLFGEDDVVLPFESCYFHESNTPNYRNMDNEVGSSLVIRLHTGIYAIVVYTYSKLFDVLAPAHYVTITTPSVQYNHNDQVSSILSKIIVNKSELMSENGPVGLYTLSSNKECIVLFLQNPEKAYTDSKIDIDTTLLEFNKSNNRLFSIIGEETTKVDAMMKLFGMRNVKTIDYIPPTGEIRPRTNNKSNTHNYKMIVRELTSSEKKQYGRREDYVYAPLEFNKNGVHKRSGCIKYYGPKYGKGLLFGKYECKVIIPNTVAGRNKNLIINNEYVIV